MDPRAPAGTRLPETEDRLAGEAADLERPVLGGPQGSRGPEILAPVKGQSADARVLPSVELSGLVLRARAGDRVAQEGIVRLYEERVLRLARQMMGSHEDAEDAAQEAFLRIFRRLDRLDPCRDPTGWVVRVTVHTCCDHLARRRRSPEESLGEAQWASAGPLPSAVAQQAQQREILQRSLQVLAPRERAVFILHEVEGEEVIVVARALRISRITVRRHLMRARARLRRFLAANYPQLI